MQRFPSEEENSPAFLKVLRFVSEEVAANDASHDVDHCVRVARLAHTISKEERHASPEIARLAGLLHDVVDEKYVSEDRRDAVLKAVMTLLSVELGLAERDVKDILATIEGCGFRKQLARETVAGEEEALSPVLKYVQDADMLDAIGAVGIARCFTFGGARNRPLYSSDTIGSLSLENPERVSHCEYQTKKAPSIDHFFEKLLHLKNMMQTETGRKLASQRHTLMQDYLRAFFDEVAGHA
ncbi:hypothetical protein BSKO_00608 [Bryopsis sp. KO-2023]|nr:hypothetical protein BSKO_00608 [Bryopsis sp. KO-2023]